MTLTMDFLIGLQQTNTMEKPSPEEEITLRYNLFDLPTAQHKAGLAGLVLLIRSLEARKVDNPLPVVSGLSATSVELKITQDSMQTVFDDLYDARTVEVSSANKRPGKPLKREEIKERKDKKTGKVSKNKIYVYDEIEPKASFLHNYPGDEKGWLKLWRDMIWWVLRSQDKARNVYKYRAAGKSSQEAKSVWKELSDFVRGDGKTESLVGKVPTSVFVGAQDLNAERVPFKGVVNQNFLLHFWPLSLQIFVPETVNRDGGEEMKPKLTEYVLAIPEVSDLKNFCKNFPLIVSNLKTELRNYRPKDSIIHIPEEGGMEFLRNLHLATQQRTDKTEIKYSVSAIDFFYLEKQGNNVKMRTAGRIVPGKVSLDKYESIRSYQNPLFKAQLLRNLFREMGMSRGSSSGEVWWAEGFLALFSRYPAKSFIHTGKTSRQVSYFSIDARKKFNILADKFKLSKESSGVTDNTTPQYSLEKIIHRMVGAYVRQKAEEKSNRKWNDFKDKKTPEGKIDIPHEYHDATQKICMDAFLAMRSRQGLEFISYFAGTICSIPQFLPQDDFVFVSQSLLEQGEKVKTLSMLALSAHSYRFP